MEKCLFCYQELQEGEKHFHKRCAKKIFGNSNVPYLDFTNEDIALLAKEVVRSQTTVTGVQAKLSLGLEKDKSRSGKRLTIVDAGGQYILKPQTELYPHLPELEDLTMHLAEIAKISVVPHTLIRFKDDEICYLTKRIDRTPKGHKLAMEDMCQLSEHLTEHKYKGSYEQIAELIKKYSSSPLLDLVNFWEVVLFSWITGNSDMHLKNFSLYSPDNKEYFLTPAYDLLSTLLVMPEDTEELALTLQGKKKKLTIQHFKEAFSNSGLQPKVIENIFKKMKTAYPLWEKCIKNSFLPVDMQNSYLSLIDQRMKLILA